MGDLSQEQTEMVAHFSGVTGTPEDFAKTFLQDNGWQLEASVNQYMALMSDEMPAASASSAHNAMAVQGMGLGGGGGGGGGGMRAGDAHEDEELQRAIAESQRANDMEEDDGDHDGFDDDDEDDDDDDEDYHVGDDLDAPPPPGASSSDGGRGNGAARRSNNAGANGSSSFGEEDTGVTMEPFRNFAAEGMSVPQSAASANAQPAAGGMELLFPPPADLMFTGNFDALRAACTEQQKYCLVNIQKDDVFASHELNRDTWKHDAVQMVVRASFIFWQQQYKSVAGGEYLNVYPTMDLPVTDIIDPLTGALLERIPGYLSPDDMLERLTRFLDSHTWGKMGKQVSTAKSYGVSQAQFHGVGGPGGADKRSRMSLENEDAALDAAIAASLQDGKPPSGCIEDDAMGLSRKHGRESPENVPHHAYSDSLRVAQEEEFKMSLQEDQEKERMKQRAEEEELMKKAIEMSQKEEKERALNERRAALPEEPQGNGAGITSLVLRMPDGSRVSRKFLSSEKLQVVYDFMFVNEVDPEEHTVATSYPRKVLDDATKTLHELGLEGQSLLNIEQIRSDE